MAMSKRGQVTLFVILGIIVVALIVLLISFRREIIPRAATVENLDATMADIEKHISGCLKEAADEPVKRIGLQGGYLSTPEGSYRRWNDYPISFLCYNQAGKDTCTNRFLTKANMEEQLAAAIKENIGKCLDIEGAANIGIIKTFDLVLGNTMDVKATILPDEVKVELDYDVQLKARKSDTQKKQGIFVRAIKAPLGELYDVSQDILDAETVIGRFDQLTYMLAKMSKFTIDVQKPYPDKIYRLKLRENNYIFQFAVEGEPS
ncbi:MAG TPA: hypothetical protein HA362_05180 [Nanoarchaeota archaeon]|nr:hypothetical protein [Nanoarchaeota archaeon]